MITWLADVLRADGLVVVEHPSWRTYQRPRDWDWDPRFGVVHATAAPSRQTDDTQISIVRNGRPDLPGPIANACVDRGGRWHVLSAGYCNTTLAGTAGPYRGLGNSRALGVEACNDNISEQWSTVQYESYARGWAAICRRLRWTPANLVGHREHTPGHKTDPTFDMRAFRTRVAYHLARPGTHRQSTMEDDDMDIAHAALMRAAIDGRSFSQAEWLAASGAQSVWDAMAAAGMVSSDGRINRAGRLAAERYENLLARIAEIEALVSAPTPVEVDAAAVAAALAVDPAFLAALRQMAFEGAQQAERE